MADEKRVKAADKALEDSMDTRLKVKDKLSSCNSSGDMGPLENEVKALSVVGLNGKVSAVLILQSMSILFTLLGPQI